MNLLELWRDYRLYEEVKVLDKKTLIHVVVAALLAGGTAAGSQYLTSDTVNYSSAITAAIAAVIALLKQSPLTKTS